MTAIASNLYYTYTATCELVPVPPAVHKLFSVVGMFSCLDFFPAVKRTKNELREYTRAHSSAVKIQKAAVVIAEAASMCIDVVWFFDELRKFTPLAKASFPLVDLFYKVLTPLQPLWIFDSVRKTINLCKAKKLSCKEIINITDLTSDLIYYGVTYTSYFVKPNPIIPSIQVACCLYSLALTIVRN